MSTSFAQPILQLFDDYGEILAGGFIHTYEAGTTTPLATYQDLDGSTPNTNPVELDAAGRAIIRLTNAVTYKFVITDADGGLIQTLDDIIVGGTSSTGSTDILVCLTYIGTPGAQGFMGAFNATEAFTFPIDFEGALGSVQTAPASDFVISIKKNGVEIGTSTISTAGAYTFATASHTTKAIAEGDTITFVGPDTVGSAADFGVSLMGAL